MGIDIFRQQAVAIAVCQRIHEQFTRLLDSDLSLGALCDIFSFALPLEPEFKQLLLEETDVEKRTRCLL